MASKNRTAPRALRTVTTSVVISRELHEWWAGEGGECDRQRRSFTAIVEALLDYERRALLGLPHPMPRMPEHMSGVMMPGQWPQPPKTAPAKKPAPPKRRRK